MDRTVERRSAAPEMQAQTSLDGRRLLRSRYGLFFGGGHRGVSRPILEGRPPRGLPENFQNVQLFPRRSVAPVLLVTVLTMLILRTVRHKHREKCQ